MMELESVLEMLRHLHDAKITRDWTVDVINFGPVTGTISKVAVTMFATTEVIRQAMAFGAQLIITHEPTFYQDSEEIPADDPWMIAKKKLVEESGMTFFRYHDHPHFMPVDLIDEGTIRYSGLKGKITGKPYWAVTSFELEHPMTARAIAETMEANLSTRHIRITGAMDIPGKRIAFACGTPGHVREAILNPDIDFVVTGELCEWADSEYIRNQAQLGGKKAVLVLGHCMSECAGMRLLADILKENFSDKFETKYFDSGDVYQFTC